MKYVKADDVLPQELIDVLQQYVDGKYLYIPRKQENLKAWGEVSGTKKSLSDRNKAIYRDYMKGMTIPELTQIYYLSDKSIRRIIRAYRCS